MLERPGLLLDPWEAEGGTARRAVRDAATGEALGFVARSAPAPRWLRWLKGDVLEVYETEDASLLCTLRGPSFGRRAWEVCDSEGRRVATVLPAVLLDAEGRPQARRQGRADGGAAYRNAAGLELATLAPAGRGLVLTFAAAVEGNPFARMALLGAALAEGA
jgi:hypothetical protein